MSPRPKKPDTDGPVVDGRRTRWDAHRESRREELVVAAVAAIDRFGTEASIDQIAQVAGVSKPVLYRYFSDKDDLHAAVGRWGALQVLDRVTPRMLADVPMKQRVYDAAAAYFEVLEEHPQVFVLLVAHRSTSADDPLTHGKATVAEAIERVMTDGIAALGLPTHRSAPWSHGVVGLGLATGEWWLEHRESPTAPDRDTVARYLADFVWGAMVGVSRSFGVPHAVEQP